MTDGTFIRIENVHKAFGTVQAVRDVSLDIAKGEVFCLLGGSGSGKSTLLRMLAGFEEVTSGRILIDGADTGGTPPERRPVNMMFQSYALFPHMTVFDNVAYGLRRDGVARAEIKARVADILDLVRMGDLGGRRPDQLSGGQRQRVALARCLVKRPKVLLLDEPLAALDKKLREQTQQELLNIQRTLGLTFIVVTHDQDEAMNLAHRVGIMDQGRIVQVGTPSEIYERPRTLFVADFVGRLNKLPGRYLGSEGGVARVDLSGDVAVAARETGQFEPGAPVIATIRPELVTIMPGTQATPPGLAGSVKFVSYLGSQTTYTIALALGREVQVDVKNTRNDTDFRPALGDAVSVQLPPADLVLFPGGGA